MKRKDLFIKTCFIGIITFLLVFSNLTFPTMITDYVTYWKSTAETTTIAWSAPEGVVDGYKVYLLWIQGSEILQIYDMGTTPNLQITLEAPRVGSFIAGVCAYNSAGDGPIAYSNNSNYAVVNGQPRTWSINYYLPKPGPIIID